MILKIEGCHRDAYRGMFICLPSGNKRKRDEKEIESIETILGHHSPYKYILHWLVIEDASHAKVMWATLVKLSYI